MSGKTIYWAAAVLVALLAGAVSANVHFGGTLSDWLKPERTLSLVGFLGGALLLAWQLGRQHRNTTRAKAEEARNALKLEIYKDIAATSERASQGLLNLASLTVEMVMDVETRSTIFRMTQKLSPSSRSFQDLIDTQHSATSAVSGVIAAIEKWEIALGGVGTEIIKSLYQRSEALGKAYSSFGGEMALYLGSDRLPLGWPVPARELVRLNETSKKAQVSGFVLAEDLYRLRVATQNRLLGELFATSIPEKLAGGPTIEPYAMDIREDPQ